MNDNLNKTMTENGKRNNRRKGFTLVEVIVVLVILAVLAAILVPTMIGWIKKANEKTAIAEARNILLASQMMMAEQYAEPTGSLGTNLAEGNGSYLLDSDKHSEEIAEILKMAEVGDGKISGYISITVENWKIKQFAYTTDSAEVTYNAGTGFTAKSK